VPITAWSEKKALIKTNVEIEPAAENGLTKKSITDCLQTRPIDINLRLVQIRGIISDQLLQAIDEALAMVFGLR
jgi:mRNA interferase MazF